MPEFNVNIEWPEGRVAKLVANGNPQIEVAAPPEFGGPENVWSPELLLVSSVGACLMNTLYYFLQKANIKPKSFSARASGDLQKTREGLRFQEIGVTISVGVSGDEEAEKVINMKENTEKYCPVSAALSCPISLEFDISS